MKFGISFTLTRMNQAGALVHVYTDGSVQLNHGGTEMGQGLFVKVAQVVAEEFGIPLDRVKITATTTEKVPNTSPTAASSGSDLNGKAAQAAARTIRERIAEVVAARVRRVDPAEHRVPRRRGARRRAQACRSRDGAPHLRIERVQLSATGYLSHAEDPLRHARRIRAGRSTTSPMARRCRRSRSTR